jgi:hypothetical protein
MITDAGLNLVRNWLAGDSVNAPSHCAVGTDDTAPAAGDTTLGAEVHRNALGTEQKGTTGKTTLKMTLLSTQANGSALKEVGILNAAASGDLVNRLTHTTINKTSSFEVRYQVEFTVAEG